MKAAAICGMLIEVDDENPSVEAVCRACPETSCETYTQYLYEVTHSNNPR